MSVDRTTELIGDIKNGALNPNGGLDVNIQDQTTTVVDLYMFHQISTFEISAPVDIDDLTVSVVSTTGMVAGHVLCFQEGTNFFQAIILEINSLVLTIDTPFDFAFSTAGGCSFGNRNMNVDGSVTPVIFRVGPGNLDDGQEWDIVRILFSMVDEAEMDDGLFGGIAALPKGLVLRQVNGHSKNIFNVKTNGEFALRNYDASYADNAKKGFYGFRSRRTFGGQSKNGVVLRLEATTNDQLQIIIQDDLTDLVTFYSVVQGHVVD